jgi:membrane-associated phospholipid phosphatase
MAADATERVRVSRLARCRRALTALALGSMALFVVVYFVGVRTRWGQRLDATALSGRHLLLSRRAIHVAREVHGTISVASIVLLGGAIVLFAVARRRPRLAIGAAVLIAGSLLTSEALKHTLTRPALGIVQPLHEKATYPSGHTTIAMALAVSAMLVAPRRHRALVAVVGIAFAATVGCSLLVTASHRPSDMIGAAFVVTAWAAGVARVLLRRDPIGDGNPDATEGAVERRTMTISRLIALAGVGLLTVSFVVAAFVALAIHYGRLETVDTGRAFVGGAAAVTGTVLTCTAALLLALDDVELDAPRRRPRATGDGNPPSVMAPRAS